MYKCMHDVRKTKIRTKNKVDELPQWRDYKVLSVSELEQVCIHISCTIY